LQGEFDGWVKPVVLTLKPLPLARVSFREVRRIFAESGEASAFLLAFNGIPQSI
jgi:hypothetical protein